MNLTQNEINEILSLIKSIQSAVIHCKEHYMNELAVIGDCGLIERKSIELEMFLFRKMEPRTASGSLD